jgi:hypothetical protein
MGYLHCTCMSASHRRWPWHVWHDLKIPLGITFGVRKSGGKWDSNSCFIEIIELCMEAIGKKEYSRIDIAEPSTGTLRLKFWRCMAGGYVLGVRVQIKEDFIFQTAGILLPSSVRCIFNLGTSLWALDIFTRIYPLTNWTIMSCSGKSGEHSATISFIIDIFWHNSLKARAGSFLGLNEINQCLNERREKLTLHSRFPDLLWKHPANLLMVSLLLQTTLLSSTAASRYQTFCATLESVKAESER